MDKVLIDTDVILDFFFNRKPYSDHAAKIFSLCEINAVQAYVTPVVISNAYYLLRQTARHEKVIEKLRQLLSFTEVLFIDKEILVQAMSSKFKDFEDAIQHYAAAKSGIIDLILTRNVKDFKYSEIGALTPENYIKTKIASR
jgi:predicted nucleic acid-binding protein